MQTSFSFLPLHICHYNNQTCTDVLIRQQLNKKRTAWTNNHEVNLNDVPPRSKTFKYLRQSLQVKFVLQMKPWKEKCYLSDEVSLLSNFTNLCIIFEIRDDLLSPLEVKLAGRIWHGTFSGGVSIPIISQEESLALAVATMRLCFSGGNWEGAPLLSMSLAYEAPAVWFSGEDLFSGEDFWRKVSIDVCRCISACWGETGEGREKERC